MKEIATGKYFTLENSTLGINSEKNNPLYICHEILIA